MSNAGVQELRIFGLIQHAHLAGVAITTRHYRNGTELPPIITEPNYDFNFQEIRKLPQERTVYPVRRVTKMKLYYQRFCTRVLLPVDMLTTDIKLQIHSVFRIMCLYVFVDTIVIFISREIASV